MNPGEIDQWRGRIETKLKIAIKDVEALQEKVEAMNLRLESIATKVAIGVSVGSIIGGLAGSLIVALIVKLLHP